MNNVSVIIPTYNREKYIKNAVMSVLNQKGQGNDFVIVEVLVIDDGSVDNTQEVVNSMDDSRIHYYRMPANGGPATARNRGADMAKGEWIAFQDSDDIWHDDKLQKQIELTMNFHELRMVSHPIRARFQDGSTITTGVVGDDDIVNALSERNYFDTPTMLIKREAFYNAGGFDTRLSALEDWEFAIRFADKFKIGMVREVLIDSEMISGGVSSNVSGYYESRCKMISWNRDILINHGCFDNAVKSLLLHAQRNDVLEAVSRMLELYLMEG